MIESLAATFIFWLTFVFTAGAFWTAIMETSSHTSFSHIYKNYSIYILVCWLPIITIIGLVIGLVGELNENIFTALYFIGSVIIFYLAWKIVVAKGANKAKFNFNWKAMSLVSWTNPKVWIGVPPGFLAANYTESLPLNIFIFYLTGIPLFYIGVYFWGQIGRQGAKIAKDKLSYFNASLLGIFALYLLYSGVSQVISQIQQ